MQDQHNGSVRLLSRAPSADAEHTVTAAAKNKDSALEEQGTWFRELGVTCLYDLENHATAQDVDELHKYTLKPEQRSKLTYC